MALDAGLIIDGAGIIVGSFLYLWEDSAMSDETR